MGRRAGPNYELAAMVKECKKQKRERLPGSSESCDIDTPPPKFIDLHSFTNLVCFSGPADAADLLVKTRPDQPCLFPGLGANLGLVTQIASENEANLLNHHFTILY